MSEDKVYKLKLCLIGEGNVGKTSLIKRYVYDEFDDKYICTIGTKVTKKILKIPHPSGNGEIEVSLMIWDIMGQQGFRQLLQDSYFFGTQGIIGVCDVTRKNTLGELNSWMDAVMSVTSDIPAIFLGNKCDLTDWQEVNKSDLDSLASRYKNASAYLSSAKTGENVDTCFEKLGEIILKNMVEQ
jgi:small GTP-binding protein